MGATIINLSRPYILRPSYPCFLSQVCYSLVVVSQDKSWQKALPFLNTVCKTSVTFVYGCCHLQQIYSQLKLALEIMNRHLYCGFKITSWIIDDFQQVEKWNYSIEDLFSAMNVAANFPPGTSMSCPLSKVKLNEQLHTRKKKRAVPLASKNEDPFRLDLQNKSCFSFLHSCLNSETAYWSF